jgi:hypothetical protein
MPPPGSLPLPVLAGLADQVGQAPADLSKAVRRLRARSRLRRSDLTIGVSGLLAGATSLLLAAGSQEAASVLAVAAVALLAGQRWALGVVIPAELLLLGSLGGALLSASGLPAGTWVALAALLPGLGAVRRGAAALVVLTGLRRTRTTCRLIHAALLMVTLVSGCAPLL